MKKILVVITTEFLYFGGLTTVMMNYYKALDKDGMLIDFASTNQPEKSDPALETIEREGSRYYCLGSRKKNLLLYLKRLRKLVKENGYDVIHVNGNSATMLLELIIARFAKVKTRIAHGHTTRSNHPFFHILFRELLYSQCTHRLAVSNNTGKWLYGRNYTVLNNAIDVNKYSFSLTKRNIVRHELDLEGCFVIGNVGKLYPAKNQMFLLDVFRHISNRVSSARLLLVGGGDLENDLKNHAKQLGISEKVVFLGMRNDIPDILQAFDVFVFPSIYEGLGLAVIEAQASGITCFASDGVPIETKVTKNINYISLCENPEIWAEKIIEARSYDRSKQAAEAILSIDECGYNIIKEAGKLELLYRL